MKHIHGAGGRTDGLDGWKLYTLNAEINKLLPDEKLARERESLRELLVSGC